MASNGEAHQSYDAVARDLEAPETRRRLILRAAGVGAFLMGLMVIAVYGGSRPSSLELAQAGSVDGVRVGEPLRKGQAAVISESEQQDANLAKLHKKWAEEREAHLQKMIALRVAANKREAQRRAEEKERAAAHAKLLASEHLARKHILVGSPQTLLASQPAKKHVTAAKRGSGGTAKKAEEGSAAAKKARTGELVYLKQHNLKQARLAELRYKEREARETYMVARKDAVAADDALRNALSARDMATEKVQGEHLTSQTQAAAQLQPINAVVKERMQQAEIADNKETEDRRKWYTEEEAATGAHPVRLLLSPNCCSAT
jgi:hypothetical protein